MRRPTSLPGLLLAAAKIQLARPASRRALGLAGLGATALVAGLAARHAPDSHACCHHPPLAAYELAPRYETGLCASTGAACDARHACAGGARRVLPFRVEVPVPGGNEGAGASATQTWSPSAAYDGSGGYGVAWAELVGMHTELFFARVNAAGERVGAPARVTDSSGVKVLPSLAAGRGGYGAAWTVEEGENLRVYFAPLGVDGRPRATPVALGGAQGYRFYARAAWNGREYGVAYYHYDPPTFPSIEFARVSAEGRVVGAPRVIARNLLPTSGLDLAWSGSEFVVAWNDYAPTADATDVKVLRVSAAGEPGRVLALARRDGLNGSLSVAAAGERAAAAFSDESLREPTNRVWFASATGGRVDAAARALTDATSTVSDPSVAFAAGDGLGVAYTDARSGGDEVYFQRLSPGGEPAGAAVRLTETEHGARAASLAFGAAGYGLAWQSGTVVNSGIYFARLSPAGARLGDAVRLSGE